MQGIFRLAYEAPLSVRVRSVECCTYLYRAMKFIGWIPPGERGIMRYIYLTWTGFTMVFCMLYIPIGFMLSLAVDFRRMKPGEFLGVLQIALNSFGATFKAIVVMMLISHLHQATLLLDKLDERLQTDEDRRRIHKAVAQCNNVFLSFGILYLSYTLSMFLSGVLNHQPPWVIYNPFFDWRTGLTLFWMQSILEYILMPIMITIDLVLDTYTLVFLIILRAHLDILKDHIRDLRSDPLYAESQNYEELVGCILYHKLILRSCSILRPAVSGTIFAQFLLIGAVLGVTMINLWYFLDIFRGISAIFYLMGILVETFPFCYLCDLLSKDCEELSNLLGQSQWIDAEPKYKTTLRIFMQHLQQPITFIAGGIFPISMTSNIKVAKIAFSVITIVRQMNLADRFK